MSNRFKAWLRVTPSPTTLAESSAIHKQLKFQGPIQGFVRALRSGTAPNATEDDDSTFFYATFAHEPLHLRQSFDVTVYDNVIDPKEADPYNIRGLQDRKPYPARKTFTCFLEKADEDGVKDKGMQPNNPWHGNFPTEKNHWFQTVLEETGAPPGIARGISAVEDEKAGKSAAHVPLERAPTKKTTIEMNTLMKPWRRAVQKDASAHTEHLSQPGSGKVVSAQEGKGSNT